VTKFRSLNNRTGSSGVSVCSPTRHGRGTNQGQTQGQG